MSSAPVPARTPHLPWALVASWLVLGLPVLLMLGVVVSWMIASVSAPSSFDALGLLFLATFSASVAATAAAYHARTGRQAGFCAAVAIVLQLLLAAPVVVGLGWALTDEWCESQPGGRGGAPITREADVPFLCR